MPQTIAVLDFGSQLTQVIARRARECQVYSKIFHYSTSAAKLREENVVGIILSGGPQSVYAKTAPHPDPDGASGPDSALCLIRSGPSRGTAPRRRN